MSEYYLIRDGRGVTAAQGFTASGVAAGLKTSGKPDVALVRNLGPQYTAAGVFTSNRVTAAPVVHSRVVLTNNTARAIVLNSGGANACTGEGGLTDARETSAATAAALDIPADEVAVASTGLIGVRLPMDRLVAGVKQAAQELSPQGGPDAAAAIMTTDTRAKQAEITTDNGWTAGGMTKGAGMIAPGLATMLCVITTDAVVEPHVLDKALRTACRLTFDRLDTDGCMSTNDTVVAMASGASGVAVDEPELADVLVAICADLARQMMADAEGAEHDITIEVVNADSVEDALEVGRAISRSNLFKTAVAGNDPNWGRVLAQIGTTAAEFDPDRLDVSFNGVQVCTGGGIGEPRENVDLTGREVHVLVDLHAGTETATILTSDLTHGYITENADYSS
ncbi:bifunctional glutamate N-acetyltransferase/amino-acid acetyltransferase ArgJ [Propionibacteriaceae bacterium Y1923]|uniref:bifunctional glutamate N-acetyltransferase/amino-acid acetyltransferase ArgJ n=1 Tax=Aestuariimicrobium sp. Y1814 TaxID=3418742 RepID=UPI003C2AA9BA